MNRFDYIAYDELAKDQQAFIKEQVQHLDGFMSSIGNGRSVRMAEDALEVFYMWCGKAIRDCQYERNLGADLEEGRSDS